MSDHEDGDPDNRFTSRTQYERTGNAAYAWAALLWAHHENRPIPNWVNAYLLDLAAQITGIAGLAWLSPPRVSAENPAGDDLQRRVAAAVGVQRADAGKIFARSIGEFIVRKRKQTGEKLDGGIIDDAMRIWGVSRHQAWTAYTNHLKRRKKRK